MFLLDLFVICFTLGVAIITYYKWKFSHWRKKGVPYIEPYFPFGTMENPYKKKYNTGEYIKKQYEHFKTLNQKFGGLYMFQRPTLLLVDTEMVKYVMAKDFQYFCDRGVYYNEKDDPLSANLFRLEGHKWRTLRAKLTPTFTSGKIKQMFQTLVDCGTPMNQVITELCQNKSPVAIKDILGSYTTDVIGSCAFGLDCNSFTDPDSEFRRYGKTIFATPTKLLALKSMFASAFPSFSRRIGITLNDPAARLFFLNAVKDTVNYRKEKRVTRHDFMEIAMDLKNEDGSSLTIEEIAAQANVFFVAGYETSSTTMAFALYELAVDQDIQKRVQKEIKATLRKHNGMITYDAIMEMKYLNCVIDETLRKYPPATTIPRICVEDYHIPGTNVIINKGTRVFIPVYALQNDPEYYPNPDKFDPERFSDTNKDRIVPFTYMPFGEGPRICIGLRFGLLQTKVGLVTLLKDFNFSLNERTQLPITFHPASVIPNVKGGIWLDIKKIS